MQGCQADARSRSTCMNPSNRAHSSCSRCYCTIPLIQHLPWELLFAGADARSETNELLEGEEALALSSAAGVPPGQPVE